MIGFADQSGAMVDNPAGGGRGARGAPPRIGPAGGSHARCCGAFRCRPVSGRREDPRMNPHASPRAVLSNRPPGRRNARRHPCFQRCTAADSRLDRSGRDVRTLPISGCHRLGWALAVADENSRTGVRLGGRNCRLKVQPSRTSNGRARQAIWCTHDADVPQDSAKHLTSTKI